MEKNINTFDEGLETQIRAIEEENNKQQEMINNIREIEDRKKEEMINSIREIRDRKKEEIIIKMYTTQRKLNILKAKLITLTSNYCEEHGHNYVNIKNRFIKKTGVFDCWGIQAIYEYTYKCQVCGHVKTECKTTYVIPKAKHCNFIIPVEIFSEYRKIKEQIDALQEYIIYLNYLKAEICKLFGHDVNLDDAIPAKGSQESKPVYVNLDDEYYKCNFCGKILSHEEDWQKFDELRCNGIIIPDSDKDLSLPSYKEYKRELIQP